MKYVANPVIVEANEIVSVGPKDENGATPIALKNGSNNIATAEMTARYHPNPGDYLVVQSDGYVYLNPKDVFERKYSPLGEPESTAA